VSAKTLVLIDTAGMAQRDARTRELLEMLQHRAISKLLVISAAAQGETLEDVMLGYGVQQCLGVIVSKLDEAVKLGPALDALIRYRAKVVGVATGQRVPEDWHRLSSQALVQRALRGPGAACAARRWWRFLATRCRRGPFVVCRDPGWRLLRSSGRGAAGLITGQKAFHVDLHT